ncbi:hypothetical protein [Paenibacillus luteus]|uniref:hypothetical protein n=1 Tax=Paenibacillus luteus TaxID=2545753 RepID=UPI001143E652|nr:hypothetical protein [Paenibacillus luteus]
MLEEYSEEEYDTANNVILHEFLAFKGLKVIKHNNNVYTVEGFKELLLLKNAYFDNVEHDFGFAIQFCRAFFKMSDAAAVYELLEFLDFKK